MTSATGNIAIIILAGGNSSRLGKPKQLLLLDGKNLLEHVVDEARLVQAGPVMVVLGANADEMIPFCKDTVIVINEHWEQGMASSICCGIEALQQQFPAIEGCIIAVCDQPLLNHSVFQELIDTHVETGQPIVAAAYDAEILGTPVYFHQRFFSELMILDGDKGAKSILQNHQSAVGQVNFPAGKLDIDTAADLEGFKPGNI